MKDVIELAKQAGFAPEDGQSGFWVAQTEDLIRFAALVGNAKLEEAAQKCVASELIDTPTRHEIATVRKCAKALESLKEPTP